MRSHPSSAPPTSPVRLVVFWAYVLIPLAWGIVNTLRQALTLFG